MSLPQFDVQGSLFESLGAIAPELFADSDKYKLFAKKVWPVLAQCREQLTECYQSDNGRPGVEPVVLLGVLIFQFLERVPDRQAVELVKYHLGWKLALNLKLSEGGFHPTTLVYFRQRLTEYGKADVAMRAVLAALQKEGLISKRSKQRLDSTHVLSAVADLSALECVRETLRLALEELAGGLKRADYPDFWELFWERYVESKLDYRSGVEVLKAKHRQAGQDCLRLLQWLEPMMPELRYGRQVDLLRQVFAQQYQLREQQPEAVKEHATGVVRNPHDPDAQWSAKGKGKEKKTWVGYKAQIAESIPEKDSLSQSRFITSIVTQRASESDDPGLDQTFRDQARSGLDRPSELYVDGAYVSALRLQQAREEGWELTGPAQPSANRAELESAYRIEAFDIDIAKRRARCPGGYDSTQCSRLEEAKRRKVSFRFEWSYHCRDCPLRSKCVPARQSHRTIVVGQYHDLLQQRRREQQTEQFKQRMHQRSAIEGTVSELARAHGLRRSRYRGFAKVELQNLFIGTACNVKRWLRIVAENQIGSKIYLLPFTNASYGLQRFFWALRLNSDSFSQPGQEAFFLSPRKRGIAWFFSAIESFRRDPFRSTKQINRFDSHWRFGFSEHVNRSSS
ncbi:MAG TPA: transposase [Chthoniobacterales bacterium]|nr:transposase [Chthoniobacterales bacterium]